MDTGISNDFGKFLSDKKNEFKGNDVVIQLIDTITLVYDYLEKLNISSNPSAKEIVDRLTEILKNLLNVLDSFIEH